MPTLRGKAQKEKDRTTVIHSLLDSTLTIPEGIFNKRSELQGKLSKFSFEKRLEKDKGVVQRTMYPHYPTFGRMPG